MKTRRILSILILVWFQCLVSQNEKKIDSLKIMLNQTHEPKLAVDITNKLFNLLKHNNPKLAFKYAQKGLKLSRKTNYALGEGQAYQNLAYYYRFLPSIDSARYYYMKSISTLEKTKHIATLCEIMDGYATFECLQGDYNKAIKISEEVFNHAYKIKSNKHLLMGLNRKTTIYLDNGNFESANKENVHALKILDTADIENSLGKAVAYGHKARIEMLRGNYSLTLKPLKKSLNIIKTLNNKQWEAVTHMEIGNAYWYLNDFDQAIKSYNQSLSISKEIHRNDFVSMNLSNIASINIEKGNYADAISTLQKSIEIEKQIGSKINLTIAYNTLAKAYLDSKLYTKAIENYSKGIALSDTIKALDVIRDGYIGRSEAYEKAFNYKASLDDLKEYIKLNDSIFTLESDKQIEELKTIYETEKKEAEIALQKEEIKTLNQDIEIGNLRKTLYAGGMFTFVAVSALLFISFKQRIKKNQLEREKQEEIYKQEIEFKKKELASQTLHLVQKNTFIQELKDNLEKIKKSPELFKVEFRRLVMLLKKESAEDKDWEVFKSYFSEVHNNFDMKLKEVYPEISEKEIRLASFLRMNLSTKEIASMLNVLPDSVLKSKYRLKKKLKLDKQTDLNHFLNSL